jgi:predicted transcriptional regulator of viral defense system
MLETVETAYIDAQTLVNMLHAYARPREAINRMVKNGELVRLKNGFYLIERKLWQGKDKIVPYEQIANFLYGPSYVSLEWAMSYYGFIPEKVYSVTNMVLGRNKEYKTPIGDFLYNSLSEDRFSIGITTKPEPNFIGGFLIATPEKALADLVHKTSHVSNKKELKDDLIEAKRIDPAIFQTLNKTLLGKIAEMYRSKTVSLLANLIGEL